MTLIVDASVAVKWFVREPLRDRAMVLLKERQPLYAPDLIIAEICNIAWRKHLKSEISAEHAQSMVAGVCHGTLTLLPSARLAAVALRTALLLGHPAYDCFYLACADAIGGTVVTADRRFLGKLAGTEYAMLARSLADG